MSSSSIKHYFFLDQSDFFTHFLDLSGQELRKPAKHITISKLQSLLELALRNPSSPASSDPFKEELKVVMSKQTLYDWLLAVVNVNGAIGGLGGEDDMWAGLVGNEMEADRDGEKKRSSSKVKEESTKRFLGMSI